MIWPLKLKIKYNIPKVKRENLYFLLIMRQPKNPMVYKIMKFRTMNHLGDIKFKKIICGDKTTSGIARNLFVPWIGSVI